MKFLSLESTIGSVNTHSSSHPPPKFFQSRVWIFSILWLLQQSLIRKSFSFLNLPIHPTIFFKSMLSVRRFGSFIWILRSTTTHVPLFERVKFNQWQLGCAHFAKNSKITLLRCWIGTNGFQKVHKLENLFPCFKWLITLKIIFMGSSKLRKKIGLKFWHQDF